MTDKLELLVENFGAYVKAVVINKIGGVATREDIEDCVSDVFLEVCRNPDSFPVSNDEAKYCIGTIAKRRAPATRDFTENKYISIRIKLPLYTAEGNA